MQTTGDTKKNKRQFCLQGVMTGQPVGEGRTTCKYYDELLCSEVSNDGLWIRWLKP